MPILPDPISAARATPPSPESQAQPNLRNGPKPPPHATIMSTVSVGSVPFESVESNIRRLQGEVLSQIESMGLPDKQETAAKDVIRQQFSSRLGMLRSIGARNGVSGQMTVHSDHAAE